MQPATLTAFDQQLRVMAAGTFGHCGRHRAEKMHAARVLGQRPGFGEKSKCSLRASR